MQQQTQLNLQLQEEIKSLKTIKEPKPPKKSQRSKKSKTKEELVEAIAIEYKVSSNIHPNYHLNGCIDRFPIDDIEGCGTDITREDVSKCF